MGIMGPISKNQTLVSIAALASLTAGLLTHTLDQTAFIGIVSAILGNAVGYLNGKKNGLAIGADTTPPAEVLPK